MIFKELTQEDKLLLLTDICGRMPFGVVCKDTYLNVTGTLSAIGLNYDMGVLDKDDGEDESVYIPKCKPYLFPLESMTEEQKNEYHYIVNYISSDDTENWKEGEFVYVDQFSQLMHFYHKNHLDYKGLIEKGLALDATGLNIY
jgi:hypothetical protein